MGRAKQAERAALAAWVEEMELKPGDVLVFRYGGRAGAPGRFVVEKVKRRSVLARPEGEVRRGANTPPMRFTMRGAYALTQVHCVEHKEVAS